MKNTIIRFNRKYRISYLLITVSILLISGNIKAQLPTAQEIAGKMKIGWNLGNTLEVVWGNPGNITQRIIDSVKAAGFNTVRLPCAWDYHAKNSVIDTTWLLYVKRIVDYCIKDSLYTIINDHWDNGWLDGHINVKDQPVIIEKQKKYWTQIANYFKDYDEHLLFAGSNEPPVKDTIEMAILMSYHQAFISAVRATGGNNSSRTLIIQGPSTSIETTNSLMDSLPIDSIENRLMVEVHSYGPYQFGLMTEDASWGKMAYYWGTGYHSSTDNSRNATWGEESEFEKLFGLMKTKFTDKGIPVILGEFGAIKREESAVSNYELHLESRKYFNNYVVYSAVNKGIIPIYWDNGWIDFNIFDRNTGAVIDKYVLDGLMLGAAGVLKTTYVKLINRASGLVIDGNDRTGDGDNCSQNSKDTSYSQQWILESVAGFVRIKNRATGLYLDGMGRTSGGSATGQRADNTSDEQQWIEEFTGSNVRFMNKATGLYLDGLGNTTVGSDLGQGEKSTNNNQLWTISTIINEALLPPPPPVGVPTSGLKYKIELFPNPFSSTFSLKIDNANEVTSVSIYDLMGKQVETISQSSVKKLMVLGENLIAGMYIIKISGSDWSHALRVSKR